MSPSRRVAKKRGRRKDLLALLFLLVAAGGIALVINALVIYTKAAQRLLGPYVDRLLPEVTPTRNAATGSVDEATDAVARPTTSRHPSTAEPRPGLTGPEVLVACLSVAVALVLLTALLLIAMSGPVGILVAVAALILTTVLDARHGDYRRFKRLCVGSGIALAVVLICLLVVVYAGNGQ